MRVLTRTGLPTAASRAETVLVVEDEDRVPAHELRSAPGAGLHALSSMLEAVTLKMDAGVVSAARVATLERLGRAASG